MKHVPQTTMSCFFNACRALWMRTVALPGGETVPALGVSPGVSDLRWPNPVRPGDVVTFSSKLESKRETKRAAWGLVGHHTRGVDQNGREVLSLHSLVFVARRGA